MTAPERGEAFVRDLLAELSRDRRRPRAWARFLARSWRSSVLSARAEPRRLRSALRWIGAGAAGGAVLLGIAALAAPGAGWISVTTRWSLWYALAAAYLLTHLGMIETDDQAAHPRVLLPNGLTFLRLALAPLAAAVTARVGRPSAFAVALVAAVVVLAATDLADGRLARRRRQTTRFGRTLDPMADIAFMTALALGLHARGILPGAVFALVLVRFPGALVGAILLYVWRGPVPVRPTRIGRATSLIAATVLVGHAALAVTAKAWVTPAVHVWSMRVLALALLVNVAALAARAVRESGS